MPDGAEGIRTLLAQNKTAFDHFNDSSREQLPVAKEMIEAAGTAVSNAEALELDYVASFARPRVAEFIRHFIAAQGSNQALRDAFRPPLVVKER